jgi:hypothetical protein
VSPPPWPRSHLNTGRSGRPGTHHRPRKLLSSQRAAPPSRKATPSNPHRPLLLDPRITPRGFLLWRFSNAGRLRLWLALRVLMAGVRKPYMRSLSSRAFAVAKSASYFLTFFPKGGTFEQVPAFMSRQPSLLGRAERSSLNARKGCATRRKGLTAHARAEQQLVIGLMTSEQILLTFVGCSPPIVVSRSSVAQFDPRLEPAF